MAMQHRIYPPAQLSSKFAPIPTQDPPVPHNFAAQLVKCSMLHRRLYSSVAVVVSSSGSGQPLLRLPSTARLNSQIAKLYSSTSRANLSTDFRILKSGRVIEETSQHVAQKRAPFTEPADVHWEEVRAKYWWRKKPALIQVDN
ncbi:hypothetical protein E2562_018620 [Oryza meyeriana var. granulata]|uniref:Uncharacterized protein n=1 Tax=Oryza meyeriana var. granulata TaxID=110450 RepID=A0A6G1BY38_9ORYZ|nr:hypothetical protein E2562_018620 [Oryza meyeriana var. granulata]